MACSHLDIQISSTEIDMKKEKFSQIYMVITKLKKEIIIIIKLCIYIDFFFKLVQNHFCIHTFSGVQLEYIRVEMLDVPIFMQILCIFAVP